MKQTALYNFKEKHTYAKKLLWPYSEPVAEASVEMFALLDPARVLLEVDGPEDRERQADEHHVEELLDVGDKFARVRGANGQIEPFVLTTAALCLGRALVGQRERRHGRHLVHRISVRAAAHTIIAKSFSSRGHTQATQHLDEHVGRRLRRLLLANERRAGQEEQQREHHERGGRGKRERIAVGAEAAHLRLEYGRENGARYARNVVGHEEDREETLDVVLLLLRVKLLGAQRACTRTYTFFVIGVNFVICVFLTHVMCWQNEYLFRCLVDLKIVVE